VQRNHFYNELENRGINVLNINASKLAALSSDPNANIGLTAAQLKSVTGIITIGHSSPHLLADYVNPPIMKALLDRTGPLETLAIWGCHGYDFYEQNTNLFYSHTRQGGPVGIFGFSTPVSPGLTQLGFAKHMWLSDPFLEFVDGTRGGGEYDMFDFGGWFWGKVFPSQ